MASEYIKAGSFGHEFLVETQLTLSSYDNYYIEVTLPDGTTDQWTGAISATTKIRYVTTDGDMDQAGTYTFQSHVTATGVSIYGKPFQREVEP